MKHLMMISLLVVLCAAGATADTWEHTYGTELPEQAFFALPAPDGGWLIGGIFIIDVSHSILSDESPGGVDCWLVRIDADGEEIWRGDFWNGPWLDLAADGAAVQDGFVLGGVATTMENGEQYWLFKIDDSGDLVWEWMHGGQGDEWAYDISAVSDGGFILAGYVDSLNGKGPEVSLLRTDGEGSELWSGTYSGRGSGMAEAVMETADGGFLVAGYLMPEKGVATPLLLKTDPDGLELWMRTYTAQPFDCFPMDMTELAGGDICLTGYTETEAGDYDIWAALLDERGELLWEKTIGWENDDMAFSVIPNGEGCLIAGSTRSIGAGNQDLLLICLDADGEEVWSETHGGPGNDGAEGILRTEDGGLIVSGFSSSWSDGEMDVWVLKLNSQGRMR